MYSWLFPKKCVGCNRKGKYFCDNCKRFIGRRQKVLRSKDIEGIVSVFRYKGVIKKGVKKFKFRQVTDLVDELMSLFEKELKRRKGIVNIWQSGNFVIVPVPLHKTRFKWRGFNQAEVVGDKMSKFLKLEKDNDLLGRVKNTKAQSEIKDARLRGRNIKGVFKLKGNVPKGVLLVDDVWTTGSTMKECAKILKSGGVKKVWGVTIAR